MKITRWVVYLWELNCGTTVVPFSLFSGRKKVSILWCFKMVQYNPVNTDNTKGTCHSFRILRFSVLSGLSENWLQTHVADTFFDQTEARRAEKFWGEERPPPLSKGLDPALDCT